jgi:hypothetical protein
MEHLQHGGLCIDVQKIQWSIGSNFANENCANSLSQLKKNKLSIQPAAYYKLASSSFDND